MDKRYALDAFSMDIKDKISSALAIVNIIAIAVGGYWTYDVFLMERRHLPHANIEYSISHIPLNPETKLLRVVITITNNGNARMEIKNTDIRIQRILPISCTQSSSCVTEEIDHAFRNVQRTGNQFAWPMIAQRKSEWQTSLDVEPGEKEQLDFEFVVSSGIKTIRVYSYIRNESKPTTKLGWHQSTYYIFSDPKREKP